MEGLGVAANVIAVVDISFRLAEWCVQYAHDVKNARTDIEKLQKEVANFQVTIGQVKSLIEGPGGRALQASRQLGSAIEDARSTLEELERKLQPSTGRKAMSRVGWRALKWPFSSKAVEETIQHLARSRGNISFALNTDHVLPVAAGAAFDSHAEEHNPTCLPDTRVELLDDIARWIDDPDAKPVFWLNGKAGTGKSTISRTVAQLRYSHGDLGASFFFKRGEVDRGSLDKFVPTLAIQLAQSVPATALAIKNTIDTDPTIVGKSVREQFDKLVREPLSKASGAIATLSSLVIVIDALDECEQDKDIKLLISILTNTQILRPRLRVFLTSRPELPIRLGFSKVKGTYKDLILDQIPAQTVGHDIFVFLADEFRRIRDDFNITVGDERKLPSDWPGQQTLQTLTRMAVPLFIFAATVCRFIDDRNCGSPPMQLQEVLNHRHKNYGSQLGLTYGPVLSSQLIKAPKDKHEQIVRDFRAIVGSIVVLASPLSVAALSQLLDISLMEGHTSTVSSVVFSHDSKMVASASDDRTARIWNVETGECEQVLKGHTSTVSSVVFSHDSKMVASASDDSTARIWNVETGECEQVLKGHSDLVNSVVFSHDSKMVASASSDSTARIWNVETGECEQVLKGHSNWVYSVVFSHDSKMVASASDDSTARIWNVETGDGVLARLENGGIGL
ncbi:hypothetical protein HZS61_007036 [Fusarium oxysporum f. sp. conglutinans]|uniref:NACHT domain-containing protein n=1 Tax=Fusarium oxysporum f. sp. conglutinans TaxID=100902 RepID=A0A8H6GA29_FUSOX|nr:hypothetical protein HZS61_007036 [Fusarium oxysporum f. sp. conglutinans]